MAFACPPSFKFGTPPLRDGDAGYAAPTPMGRRTGRIRPSTSRHLNSRTKFLIVLCFFGFIICWIGLAQIQSYLHQTAARESRLRLNDDLIGSVSAGDLRRVQSLIESGASP